jgi:hypothetical protein
MSSWRPCRLECAVCHQANNVSLILSTNTFGGVSDLDTRLGGVARTDTVRAIQRCTGCGYCAPKLSLAKESAAEVVRSALYKQVVDDPSLPQLARSWLGWSMIAEEAGEPVEAGWAALSGAWACDDDKCVEGAERARNRAADLFEGVVRAGQKFSETPGGDSAILADILRRCGRFAEAIEHCTAEVPPEAPESLAAGLAFQRSLCERQDRQRYSFGELERYRRAPDAWKPIRWWEIWRG